MVFRVRKEQWDYIVLFLLLGKEGKMNKLEKARFKTEVLSSIRKKLGDAFEVMIQETFTTNREVLAITMWEKNSPDKISPAIYLDSYYEDYENGMSFSFIAEEIIRTYQDAKASLPFNPSEFFDFEKVKGRIFGKLVNAQRNQKLLDEVPYIPFLDLAIIFYIDVDDTHSIHIPIKNEYLFHWRIDANILVDITGANIGRLHKQNITNIVDALAGFCLPELEVTSGFEEETLQMPSDHSPAMYVLSNTHKMFGAIYMVDMELLEEFSLAKNVPYLFILPSSVHEVILIPTYDITNYKEINRMIQEINQTTVAKSELLSDHCYLYRQGTKNLIMLREKM